MSNLSNIREEILKDNAKRIIIRVKTKGSEDCRDTAYRIVGEIFPDWKQDNRILFLAIQVWGNRIFVNVDVNGDNYNYDTAHKDQTVLPVRGCAVSGTASGYWICAEIPFYENRNSHVVHANPREYLK
ncbi:uncharacterized protein AKAW2_60232A [Aspergillus luchuensis]|uniref:Uncharacterized protein n=1 Tax=Aspergillus kawachii TaxID=1069201 RepID=A0A7R8ADT6_ASPKA|nr:uncharacterized protein AKAW2_60232A [Aspergillus luchuensis]BCS01968.1 hypothetical protein AKAW2_60232A [Aspergillus luchuensis]BCS13660.1 hypothetical protein ALUC_60216A [Aspergillus luchuensis]